MFDEGLHKYTFENRCIEQPHLSLNDDSTKIFLCAGGNRNDVSEEMKAFLDYVGGKATTDEFTERIDKAVEVARNHEKWRVEYMTLQMRDNEMKEIGKQEEARNNARNLFMAGASYEMVRKGITSLTDEEIREIEAEVCQLV